MIPLNFDVMRIKLLTLLAFSMLLLFACKEPTSNDKVEEQEKFPIAVVSTSLGTMYFWLYDETPVHKAKFMELANIGHYNQFTFNRVIKNFVVQGGCPDLPQYFENSSYLLDPEFIDSLKHTYGALGMGRDDNPGKQSNACQFYIVNKESGLPNLDGDYMIFGKLIKGEDILEATKKVATNSKDEPITPLPLDVKIQEFTNQELLDSLGFRRVK